MKTKLRDANSINQYYKWRRRRRKRRNRICGSRGEEEEGPPTTNKDGVDGIFCQGKEEECGRFTCLASEGPLPKKRADVRQDEPCIPHPSPPQTDDPIFCACLTTSPFGSNLEVWARWREIRPDICCRNAIKYILCPWPAGTQFDINTYDNLICR